VLSPDQQERRAAMAVAQFLFKQLIVPKVYLHAAWPRRTAEVDVLAIDRAGTGDVHVVEVKFSIRDATVAIEQLVRVPGHFKYLAVVGSGNFRISEGVLYSPDGVGRVGVIRLDDAQQNLTALLTVRPERFRMDPSYVAAADKFVRGHKADLEIRSAP
jgi:hypothetical protein